MANPPRGAALRAGAAYELPNGERLIAEYPGQVAWFLRAPATRRAYLIDATARLRLIAYEDAAGEPQLVAGERGDGALTDFTVADLRPVTD